MTARARYTVGAVLVVWMALPGRVAAAATDQKFSEKEVEEIGIDAYIFGYPLVTMEMTRRRTTNVTAVEDARAPMGQFAHMRRFPAAADRDVPGANVDTLYSTAWLDLSREPYVLTLPDEAGRYFMMSILSGWTDVFAVPGTRTTGTRAQAYLLTGPGWKGAVPAGLTEYKSPTNLVWIFGQTYCSGTAEDYRAVHAIQDQYSLVPLTFYGKPYTPPAGDVDPTVDAKVSVGRQVNGMDAPTYFRTLAALLNDNPPSKADSLVVEEMGKIGLVPGQEWNMTKLDPVVAKGLQDVPRAAQAKMLSFGRGAIRVANGWRIVPSAGVYGTNYLLRAYVNALGLGWNRSEDAVYPLTFADASGSLLDGTNRYVVRFPKGELPPVKGFWSLTMYDAAQRFLVANSLNRFAVGSRSDLKYDGDGSLEIYIQKDSPGAGKEANWLPAPSERFGLMLRLYWPNDKPPTILDGSWAPPPVKRLP